jgi:poly(3-hydroxybutyrate) depolymerase
VLGSLVLALPAAGQTDSFLVAGVMRSFIVHAPSGLVSPPLVINMHGLGSNAGQQQAYTRFDPIADREGFVMVYPNGLSNTWDITGNGDVPFILALIDTLARRNGIDRNRVYATGFSMGGYMSHRLGCAASDRIAAIGPVSGLNASSYNCATSRPMPVMQIHGTADSTVRYSGVAATISGWVSRNGCPATAVVTDPYPASSPASATKKDYYGPCGQGSEVVLLTVAGAGHVWPGGYGATTFGINASEELWAFFKGHALAVVEREGVSVRPFAAAKPSRMLDMLGRLKASRSAAGPGVYLLVPQGSGGMTSIRVSVP